MLNRLLNFSMRVLLGLRFLCKTSAYFSSSVVGLSLLASLSRTERYSLCWPSDVNGVGELTLSAYLSDTAVMIVATPSRHIRRDSECAGCQQLSNFLWIAAPDTQDH